MNVIYQAQNEKQNLMSRLLDAVKQCQVRFGGKSELATEIDSSVSCLCSSLEAVLQHGMKHSNRTLSTLKQMTEMTGLNKTGISLLDNVETEPVFWHYVKEHLSKHEVERYMRLHHVNTDAGRGRAWLRSAFNEHSMERYMHMLIENDTLLGHFYEPWAFLSDQEKRNTLPNMAGGLGSILFAINIDNEELNTIRPAKGLDELLIATTSPTAPYGQPYPGKWDEYRPVISGEDGKEKRKDKKKKKKVPKIVSFDDVEYANLDKNSPSSSSLSSPKRIIKSLKDSGFNRDVAVSLPTSPRGFIVECGRGNIPSGLLQSQDSFSSCDTTSLSEADTNAQNNFFPQNHYESSRKPRSYSLDEMKDDIETDLALHPKNQKDISQQQSHSIPKTENVSFESVGNLESPKDVNSQSKNSSIKKFFTFGSSTSEIKRSSSRTSLDSVQSSKSEQALSVSSPPENKSTQPPHKKGHRKSLSDTSMLVTNFGSRIFKTVVEETKKRLAFGESEGSLSSSRASSTKSLNESSNDNSVDKLVKNISQNNVQEAIEMGSDLTDNPSTKNPQDPPDRASANKEKSNFSRIPSVEAAVGAAKIKNDIQSVQQQSVRNSDVHAKVNFEASGSSQKKDILKHPPVIKRNIYSEPCLPSMDSCDDSSDIGIPSDLIPLNPEGMPIEGATFHGSARDSPCSQDNTSGSIDSSDFQSYTEVTQQATLAVALAQRGCLSSDMKRTQGDGSNYPDGLVILPDPDTQDSMTSHELKEAIIAMMKRKDEVEEQSRHLRFALEAELEVCTALRMEIDELKKTNMSRQERDADKIKDVSRENDLLKHQLRKYVSAVQLLRRQGARDEDFPGIHLEDEVQPTIPPTAVKRDYSHEAEEYEKKLIQVAEMHGELMEFNENLHKQLLSKEFQVKRLQQELTDLRGPLPADISEPDDDMSIISELDGDYLNRPLINIWIPSAFLKGKPSDGFHVYQVYIRIRDEEWNIYRRYTEFLEMHLTIKKKFPLVATFEFPPKKAIGNKEAKFVEMRRKKLQVYLRRVINLLSQNNQEFTSGINRQKLTKVLHFFGDQTSNDKKSKGRSKSTNSSGGQSSQQARRQPQQPHYSGL